MLDPENLQSWFSETIKNQIVFKIIHAPGADVLQIAPAKMAQPAFERLQRQIFHGVIHGFKKAARGVGIVLEEVLEVTECVQLGIVTNEDFNRLHAAVARRRLREASAAKWPGLYLFNGLRNECRKAASSSGSCSSTLS